MTKQPSVASSMPCEAGMLEGNVRNDGQIAPIIHLTVYAPFMVCIANQKIARIALEIIATYDPQNPHEERAITGNGT